VPLGALGGGQRLSYGARAITAGGLLSLPKTVFPGAALVGCEAGYLNATMTGMLAAEAAFEAIGAGHQRDELTAYPAAFEQSWLHAELLKARNFKQWFKKGRTTATLMTGIELRLLPKLGVAAPPWTLHLSNPNHARLQPTSQCARIDYPKPDSQLEHPQSDSRTFGQPPQQRPDRRTVAGGYALCHPTRVEFHRP